MIKYIDYDKLSKIDVNILLKYFHGKCNLQTYDNKNLGEVFIKIEQNEDKDLDLDLRSLGRRTKYHCEMFDIKDIDIEPSKKYKIIIKKAIIVVFKIIFYDGNKLSFNIEEIKECQ